MEMGESPQTDDFDLSSFDAVTILTVHGSKGLEFPVVFLTNLIKGRFPTYEKKEAIPIPQELIKELLPQGDYHLEEERRLFYVGMTRAMDKVYMTASNSYGEGKRERKVSPFIGEAVGEEEVMKHMNVKREEKNQLSIFDFKRPEEPILTDQFILKNFSFSQLESYKNCGLQYKYQYLLKIPAPAGSAAAFGDTVHKTLQKFYEEYMQNKSLGLDEMLTMYEKLWVPIGYTSASHQERMKKEGKEMLARFYEKFHPPQSSIGSLEKLFKIRIDNDVFVTGKIDRVDVKENGSIEIIDYKTGKKPNEKELQKSLQLSIYALAATDRGLYNKPVEQVTLTFYYLQDMDKISMQRTAGDLLQVKQDILSMVTDLRTNKFLPKVGPHCNFCPFRMICEAWQ
jgi:DNA helicase-2/ATP-dependent DNA helicase PcrA